jgi:molybdate transport system substrate-binding protein
MPGRSSLVGHVLALAMLAIACKGSSKANPNPNPNPAPVGPITVAAAADLRFAFKDMGDAFEKKTGQKVVFSYGSTGLLAKQISDGAPFDVFAAANVSFVDDVLETGACEPDSKALYARGRIVLFTTKEAAAKPASLADLTDPKFGRIAIANPEHAPYGKAAKEALTKAGVWEKVSPKVVYGENIQQTLEFAQSGNADAAIVALSLATVTPGDYVVIDPQLYAPIDQALVVCKGAQEDKGAKEPAAGGVVALVNSEDGRAIMRKYGFLLPSESMVEAKQR